MSGDKMKTIFDGKKTTKLGTKKNPAIVCAQTEERVRELESVFEENGWSYKIKLEPDNPEDIKDLEILLNPIQTRIAEKKVGRNETCPCGSGKKYKKCCGI
jgi:SWIM/SEC-C metal-binding protein